MAGKKEGESSRRKLTDQKKASHKEQPGSHPEKHELVPSTEQEALSADFWNEFMKRASIPPFGEDTAFWPISMLIDFKSITQNREYIRNQKKREYVEKLVPLEETLRKVDTSYKIITYLYIKKPNLRHLIEVFLEHDPQYYGRDQVTLTDAECEIIRRICETPRYALVIESSAPYEATPIL